MTKTREQLAVEHANNSGELEDTYVWRADRDGFLAGYQAAQQWISVKDRLPEKEDIGDIFLVWNAYDRDVSTVRWQPYGFDDVNDMYISHWMPLPEIPEDKGKAHWQELREFWKARNVTISEWQEDK
tara:strand:- start:7483 stop:7863 length:381 start_codon:yes stop_codon:yes gene_type:complete